MAGPNFFPGLSRCGMCDGLPYQAVSRDRGQIEFEKTVGDQMATCATHSFAGYRKEFGIAVVLTIRQKKAHVEELKCQSFMAVG